MVDYAALASAAYGYAEANYGRKGARYDVIVECMEKSEIAEELEADGVTDEAGAFRWADKRAGLMHEVELNQAWDGPESCIGSERYDPRHDPAGNWQDEARDFAERQAFEDVSRNDPW